MSVRDSALPEHNSQASRCGGQSDEAKLGSIQSLVGCQMKSSQVKSSQWRHRPVLSGKKMASAKAHPERRNTPDTPSARAPTPEQEQRRRQSRSWSWLCEV